MEKLAPPQTKSSRQQFKEIAETHKPTDLLGERLQSLDDEAEIKKLDKELGELSWTPEGSPLDTPEGNNQA